MKLGQSSFCRKKNSTHEILTNFKAKNRTLGSLNEAYLMQDVCNCLNSLVGGMAVEEKRIDFVHILYLKFKP